jgi:hypothetical protein
MLHLLDEALEDFLRATVPLAGTSDIAFEAPDRDWSAGRSSSRTTINLYLWDVRPNLDEREFGLVEVSTSTGRRRQEPLPRVDCRYLVTAWGSSVGDEHTLLGQVLTALLLHPVVDPEHLPPQLASVLPLPTLGLRGGAGAENSDFWSALGGQLKPGLDLVVTATVDAAALHEVGPPVDAVVLRQRDRQGRGTGETVVADSSTARARDAED